MSNSCRAAGILCGHGDELQVEKIHCNIYCHHPFPHSSDTWNGCYFSFYYMHRASLMNMGNVLGWPFSSLMMV